MVELVSAIDSDQMVTAMVASIIAALTVTIVVCLAIWGAVKYADFSQSGRATAAAGALTVSFLGLAATFAIVAYTIFLMVTAPE